MSTRLYVCKNDDLLNDFHRVTPQATLLIVDIKREPKPEQATCVEPGRGERKFAH